MHGLSVSILVQADLIWRKTGLSVARFPTLLSRRIEHLKYYSLTRQTLILIQHYFSGENQKLLSKFVSNELFGWSDIIVVLRYVWHMVCPKDMTDIRTFQLKPWWGWGRWRAERSCGFEMHSQIPPTSSLLPSSCQRSRCFSLHHRSSRFASYQPVLFSPLYSGRSNGRRYSRCTTNHLTNNNKWTIKQIYLFRF